MFLRVLAGIALSTLLHCCQMSIFWDLVQPKALFWPWNQQRNVCARNDFFQFGKVDCLAIGGAPRYALKLDGDLQFGSSGQSDTYGCPCLASSEDFTIGRVELWGLV